MPQNRSIDATKSVRYGRLAGSVTTDASFRDTTQIAPTLFARS